jgi:beta-lactam-binding protein with PASTA domain
MRSAALTAVLVALVWVVSGCQGESATTTVPDVLGLRAEEAIEVLESAGLEARVSRQPFVMRARTRVIGPLGTVIAQAPIAGAEVALGTTLSIVVRRHL